MRTLIILRHAKSSWATPGMDDFERPLNERGNADAILMAQWISEKAPPIDAILCSSAARTRATAKHITTFINTEEPISYLDELYLAGTDTLKAHIAKLDSATKTAMLIGHNPGLHDAALRLLTKDHRDQAGSLRMAFPTTACALIKLPIDDWKEIAWNNGELSSFMVPKSLKTTQKS